MELAARESTEVILVEMDLEVEEMYNSEENTTPPEDIENVRFRNKVPKVVAENKEDEMEDGYVSFADVSAVEAEENFEENTILLPEPNGYSFATVFIREEDGTIEESSNAVETSNLVSVYELGSKAMEGSTMPKARSTKPSRLTVSDEERPYLCPHCPRRFREKKNLITHLEVHSDNKFYTCTYTCTVCALTFPDIKQIRMHLVEHEVKKPYSCNLWCNFCSAKFKLKEELKDHMKQHKKKTSSSAAVKSSINSDLLIQEMKKNFQSIELKVYSCTQCPATFKEQSVLTDHMNQHTLHGDSSPPQSSKLRTYSCKLCKTKFLKEFDLANHVIKQHHNRKNLKCKLCGNTLASVSNLNLHLKMCSRQIPFSCIRCKATFPRKQDMHAHFKAMHIHANYTCGHCYADFHKKYLLIEHLQTHPYSYPCPECPFIFNLESSLKIHLKQH